MDEKTQGFVLLIDRALQVAKEKLTRRESGYSDPAPPGALENIVSVLNHYKKEALANKIAPSEGIVTTGILREVADWGETSDSELLQASRAIERYYLEFM